MPRQGRGSGDGWAGPHATPGSERPRFSRAHNLRAEKFSAEHANVVEGWTWLKSGVSVKKQRLGFTQGKLIQFNRVAASYLVK